MLEDKRRSEVLAVEEVWPGLVVDIRLHFVVATYIVAKLGDRGEPAN